MQACLWLEWAGIPACILIRMRHQLRHQLHQLFSVLACAAFLIAAAHAAPLQAHKVATLPTLHPLPIATGGRMLATPSPAANNFGATDFVYQWPGTYFRAAFRGSQVYFRVVAGKQILHIVIDNQSIAPLVKPDPGVYAIDGLTQTAHTIEILIATESQDAPNTFGGFAVPANEKPLTPPRRQRQIEFIGDSHTVGYGNLSATHNCTEDEVWANTDDTQAFGALTAAHYDADYQVNAISGRGVVRNYDGTPADTLPQAYPYVLFDKQQKVSDPAWHPQVIVLALGTNDFTTKLHPNEPWKTRDDLHRDYEATYAQFLEQLRARNPRALFIVWATDMVNGEIEAEAQKVVHALEQQGDHHIQFLPIDGLSFTACNWHPSLADDQVIAAKLIHVIDADQQAWNHALP
jgi:lysophospholipase L1-like esterase